MLKVDSMSINEEIEKILPILQRDGVVIYPTDTVWGIGCQASSMTAVKQIFQIKKRADSKKMVLLVDSHETLKQYVDRVPPKATKLIDHSKRPITIIYEKAKNLPTELIAADGSIAIRVIKDPFCQQLIQAINEPLVSTSANFSGDPPPKLFSEINPDLIALVDYTAQHRRPDTNWDDPSVIIKILPSGELFFIRK